MGWANLEAHQGRGLGCQFLKKYHDVRQVVLLTDDTEKPIQLYEKNGLKQVSQCNCVVFIK